MKRNNLVLILLFLLLSIPTYLLGQELNATVTVSTPKLQTTDPAVFKTLEKDLQDFLNQERWTQDEYKGYERIDCNFSVNIVNELGGNAFQADIAVKASRPVYGSEYETVLINFADRDIVFNYQEYQPIENNTEFFRDNLSAVFSFYVQLILALDAASFAPEGGEPYFQKVQNIINLIPSAISDADKGWTSLSRKTTRYWIAENYLSPRFNSFKEAWYNYHRKSLDIMHADVDQAINTMIDALREVEKTNANYPNSAGVILFLASKSDEVVDIMKHASTTQKSTVYEIMRKLDPGNTGKYNAIRG